MANEELKEQLDLAGQLNRLSDKYNETQGEGNSTLKDRVYHLQEAVANQDDNNKLGEIQKDLLKKANYYAKIGHGVLAKKLTTAAKTVTQQISSNKVEEKNKKLQEKLGKEREKQISAVSSLASSTGTMIGLGGGLLTIFTKFNEMTRTIGKNFGALGMQNKEFKEDVLEAGAAAVSLGQNIGDAVGISSQLTKEFGFGMTESIKMAKGIMDTSMALGLSNDEGTKLLGSLTQIAGMSFDTAQNFAKQTALLAQAEGVSPQAVLKDIAQSSEAIAKFTSMTPDNLAKAAIQATKLGTTLNTIAGSMESVLSFQDSLNAEIEASILLGRSVNLQKARELALAGETEAFAVEITKQVGSQAEFERMNVFERKSLAKALGINVEQMAKMVNNQDKVRTIGEAISEQKGLEDMIGRKAMDSMAQIVADLQKVGAELVISIGPTVAAVAGGIAAFTQGLSESTGIIPVITTLLGLMLGKSILNFAFSAATALGLQAGFLGPLGMGLILGIPAIIGGLIGGLSSFQDLPVGKGASLKSGKAIFDKGETVVNDVDLAQLARGGSSNGGGITKNEMELAFVNALKPVIAENRKMREQNETLISTTRAQATKIGVVIGEMA